MGRLSGARGTVQEALTQLRRDNLLAHRRGVCGYELCSPERIAEFGLLIDASIGSVAVAAGAITTCGRVTARHLVSGNEVTEEFEHHLVGADEPDPDGVKESAIRWFLSPRDNEDPE